ncbi:MAG: LutB/LldF family L-lactate oxidation iron-sulfur protein [Nitrococcus sp.]|nr:LutB/LldF family L-lactate oxidation iron-sulfur protein [Nitrococcus sp.]
MKSTAHHFKANARAALLDEPLQQALHKMQRGFVDKRAAALREIPDFDALREQGKRIKDHALAHLDVYLERFDEALTAQGGHVHWALDADAATEIILDICRRNGARRVIKSKTMVGEEIDLNTALASAGLETIESDLGEYIIQLANEPPSHIIAPAVHKTRATISSLFDLHHHQRKGQPPRAVGELVNEARGVLREKFLTADVGISGANFLIAETGTVVLVTNEGNADLSATLPRVHIVIAGIDKIVASLADVTPLLRLLGRSATGQAMSAYTTFITGPRRAGERDGPVHYHVVLLDNGRTRMLGGEFRAMLRCIRCGACLNHCPVYSAIGGHAYGWVYPGPMGSVLTPLFVGLQASVDLPNACTLNGRCEAVCPVKIPLPELLRRLRDLQLEQRLTSRTGRWALRAWGWLARRPRLYHASTRLGVRLLRVFSGKRGAVRRMPLAGGWTASRDLPLPAAETFQTAWRRHTAKSPP